MSDTFSSDDDLLHDTQSASEALRQFGVRLSASTLRKMRVTGEGPGFIRARRSIYYPLGELKAWAIAQRSPVVRSTSELSAINARPANIFAIQNR
jgi:hypothetical protein